jgi:hypothetical protein
MNEFIISIASVVIPASAQTTAHYAIYNEPPPPIITKPSREDVEKSRLMQRKEGFTRYTNDTIGPPLPIKVPTYTHNGINVTNQRDSAWKNGTSDVLKVERRQEYTTYQTTIDNKRDRNGAREETRWRTMREKEEAQMDHVYKLQSSGKNRKNISSMPISPITGDYNASREGLELLHKDQQVKYSAALRAYAMDHKGNSNCNPITGLPRQGFPAPIPPPSSTI